MGCRGCWGDTGNKRQNPFHTCKSSTALETVFNTAVSPPSRLNVFLYFEGNEKVLKEPALPVLGKDFCSNALSSAVSDIFLSCKQMTLLLER